MRWEDERYVRLFVRDTTTWKLLPWQAKCLLPLILRKLDRSGLAEVGKTPERGIAALIDVPEELVKEGLPALLREEIFLLQGGVLSMPNFVAAQECLSSSAQRKRAQREKLRSGLKEEMSRTLGQVGTTRDNLGQAGTSRDNVTPCCAVPCLAVPCCAVPSRAEKGREEDLPLSGHPDLAKTEPPAALVLASPSAQASPAPRKKRASLVAKKPKPPRTEPIGGPTWDAYSEAYTRRYGTEPVRNARTNSCVRKLVELIGAEEAPMVAAFYVSHLGGVYAQKGHALPLLVANAESLRTQWLTQRPINSEAVRREERSAANPARAYAEELRRQAREDSDA